MIEHFNYLVHVTSKNFVFDFDVGTNYIRLCHEPSVDACQRRKFSREAKNANISANISQSVIVLYLPNEPPRVISMLSNSDETHIQDLVFSDDGLSFVVFFPYFYRVFRTTTFQILQERHCVYQEISNIHLTNQAVYYIRKSQDSDTDRFRVCRHYIHDPYGIESILFHSTWYPDTFTMLHGLAFVVTNSNELVVYSNLFINERIEHSLPTLHSRPVEVYATPILGFCFDVWVLYENKISIVTPRIQNIMDPDEQIVFEEIQCSDTQSELFSIFQGKPHKVQIVGRTCFIVTKDEATESISFLVFEFCLETRSLHSKVATFCHQRFGIPLDINDVHVNYGQCAYSFNVSDASVCYTLPFVVIPDIHPVGDADDDSDPAEAEEIFVTESDTDESSDSEESTDSDESSDSEESTSDESDESEGVIMLNRSMYQPQPCFMNSLIEYVKLSVANFYQWNEIQFPSDENLKLRISVIFNSVNPLELLQQVQAKNDSARAHIQQIIQRFTNERDHIATFFNTSKTIGSFDIELTSDPIEPFDFNAIERLSTQSPSIVNTEIFGVYPSTDVNSVRGVMKEMSISNNYRIDLICYLNRHRVQNITDSITTGVISTMNVMISQLNDSLQEIEHYHTFLSSALTFLSERQNTDVPLAKKLCLR